MVQNASNQNHDRLMKVLDHMETALDTPVVPGELSRWLADVQKTSTGAFHQLRSVVEDEHASLFLMIANEDDELLSRVADLKQADDENLSACDEFVERIAASESLKDAGKLFPEEKQTAVVRRGQEIVAGIRQQETAIRAWSQEAVTRDRGVAD